MTHHFPARLNLLLISILAIGAGCTSQTADTANTDPGAAQVAARAGEHVHSDGTVHKQGDDHHDQAASKDATAHGHPHEGPHHGSLIELGDDEFHGELVRDADAGLITIYILDSSAVNQYPISPSEITVNGLLEGKPTQFTLSAKPDTTDPEGKSSCFVSDSSDLGRLLNSHDARPRLVVEIDGNSFKGAIAHDHDHEH